MGQTTVRLDACLGETPTRSVARRFGIASSDGLSLKPLPKVVLSPFFSPTLSSTVAGNNCRPASGHPGCLAEGSSESGLVCGPIRPDGDQSTDPRSAVRLLTSGRRPPPSLGLIRRYPGPRSITPVPYPRCFSFWSGANNRSFPQHELRANSSNHQPRREPRTFPPSHVVYHALKTSRLHVSCDVCPCS